MRAWQAAFGVLTSVALAGAPSTARLGGVVWVGSHREANAVVWLDAPNGPAEPRRHAVLDQRNLAFSPRVLAVRVGTVVEFPNNDRVFHNVFSFRDGRRFDLGFYPVGAVKHVTFDRPGLSRIFCNIHPNMAAYVFTVESAYFAVSEDTGVFAMPSVPAGTYPYHAWRPGGSLLTGSVSVDGETTIEIRWP